MPAIEPDRISPGGADDASRAADVPLLAGVLAAFFVFAGAGALLLSQKANPAGNPMSPDRALFASLNAITLTGFELAPAAVRELQPAGRCILAVLMLAGALLTQIAGASLLSSLLGLGYSRLKICLYAIGTTAVLSLLGAGFLMQPGESFLCSIADALGGFSNSGLCFADSWSVNDWRLHGVLLPLALLGGLGLPVLIEFAEGIALGKPLSAWSRRMITLSCVAYFVGLVLLLLMEWQIRQPVRQWIASASANSLNARSLGVVITESTLRWPAVAWSLMLLMLLGAAPGGTAGGLRLTSVAALLKGTRRLLRGDWPGAETGAAMLWIASYFTLLAAMLLSLLATEGSLSADRVAFIAVSAVTNSGLSHDPMSVTGSTLYLVSAGMLAGRLMPLLFGWWMLKRGLRDAIVA